MIQLIPFGILCVMLFMQQRMIDYLDRKNEELMQERREWRK